jgi:serine/threonine protein kinase
VAFTVGQTVGDYRITGVIGSGGMGTVYRAQHLISERVEALKVILPSLIESPELADRFMREIRLQARLNHPNITSLYNAFRADNQLIMAMEYVEGITLHSKLRHGGVDPALAINIVLQVLSALAYAHAQGVVHRDIKPANIMLTTRGDVKLMDFGIARSLTDKQLTHTGAAIGSVYYMSPEQVQGAPIGQCSDLYSVGIMLYEMVTGQRPIDGDSSWAVMNAHLHQVPRSPAVINAGLPVSLCLAILKAIEKDPANRYQSAEEMAAILEALRQRHPALMITPAAAEQTLTELATHRMVPPAGSDPDALLRSPVPSPRTPPTPAPALSRTPASSVSGRRFDPEKLESVKDHLARSIGPMARIVVDRAAKKCETWKQLYDMLAPEFESAEDRKKFLATRPRD